MTSLIAVRGRMWFNQGQLTGGYCGYLLCRVSKDYGQGHMYK